MAVPPPGLGSEVAFALRTRPIPFPRRLCRSGSSLRPRAGVVQSGQSVYLHCAAATPSVVLQALVDRAHALPSTAAGGTASRIVYTLREGAGVVTTRAHVRTVVTEWGVAELFGKSLRERANALIAIAHPDFRADLHREASRHHLV